MNLNDYLKDELKRLNRQNDLLEKKINTGIGSISENNENQEIIIKNALTMCEIVKTINS